MKNKVNITTLEEKNLINNITNISIIGAGNVANILAKNLVNSGYIINQIYNRTKSNAVDLVKELSAEFISDLSQLNANVDLIIVTITDTIIEPILNKININETLIVHTSGSISIDVFSEKAINYGVFYPLQTITKNNFISLKNVPICLEANNEKNLSILRNIAGSLSSSAYEIDSKQRKILHLAAVFACNFTNHMYNLSSKILEKNNLDFDILKPLIAETAGKVENFNPSELQTGPAIRNDKNIINNHIELLNDIFKNDKSYKNISEIYSFVSDDIYLKSKLKDKN